MLSKNDNELNLFVGSAYINKYFTDSAPVFLYLFNKL